MFGLGTQEILIILAVALIIFGPKKLPEIGKSLGQGLRELKKASRDIMDTMDRDVDEPEPRPAWTSEPVSHQPLDQVENPATQAENAAGQVVSTEDQVASENSSEQSKETVYNAADSNRD